MDYIEALIDTLCNKEFVKQYDRLTESKLGMVLKEMPTGNINSQIDIATGRVKEEIEKFSLFFYEFVWSRLPDESFA